MNGNSYVLSRENSTDTESDLYHYAGYYVYENKPDKITYIRTDHNPYGYHIPQRNIHPGTMRIQEEPNLETAITFHTKEKTITTNNAVIDYELLRLIQKRAEELNFEQHRNADSCLVHKLKRFAAGHLCEIQPEDIQQALSLAVRLYDTSTAE